MFPQQARVSPVRFIPRKFEAEEVCGKDSPCRHLQTTHGGKLRSVHSLASFSNKTAPRGATHCQGVPSVVSYEYSLTGDE